MLRPRAVRATTTLRSVDAIRVTVRRGDVVEAVHRVHVATTDGERWGDDLRLLSAARRRSRSRRSRFVEGYDDLDDDEIAIACASHHAEPAQLEAVRKVLARARARRSTTSRTACRSAGPTGSSATTAPASTRACSPRARRTAGRCIRTATPTHPLQQRIAEADRRRRDRGRRLRRADVRADARAAPPSSLDAHAASGSATRCAPGPSWSAPRAARPTPT